MNKLRELRKTEKVSVEKLSEYLDISISYYYDLEKGSKRLNEDILNKIADFYDCSVDYILGRVGDKNLKIVDKESLPEELQPYVDEIVMLKNSSIKPEQVKELIEFLEKAKKF